MLLSSLTRLSFIRFLFFIIFWLTCKEVFALELRSGRVTIPDYADLEVSPGVALPVLGKPGQYRIYFFKRKSSPVKITLTDPFGAHITYAFDDPSQLDNLTVQADIVETRFANPEVIDTLPRLCPRTQFTVSAFGRPRARYFGERDPVNRRPAMQLFDSDARELPEQSRLGEFFDGKNTLRLRRARVSYDYEDSRIVDFRGLHPLTGAPNHVVMEGEGGFYANFHYAVVPFEARFLRYSRQQLLSMVQGKLRDIDRVDLRPSLRVHGFIPGPYVSKEFGIAMCEWGDTLYQAKEQELYYEDMELWDWDITRNGRAVDRVLIIVWEGDEEAWMVADKIIDPFYLTDDIVGLFVVDVRNARKPLVLKNPSGDFEMEVVTAP